VPPGVVTLMGPEVAPAGTVAWIAVAEVTLKVALVPLNATALAPVKFVPLMVTLVPTGPLAGVNPEIVGACTVPAAAGSPPSHPMNVNADVKASIPTSPVGYEPSVLTVNWETPFRDTTRCFQSAVSRHLSPARRVGGVLKPPMGRKFPGTIL